LTYDRKAAYSLSAAFCINNCNAFRQWRQGKNEFLHKSNETDIKCGEKIKLV